MKYCIREELGHGSICEWYTYVGGENCEQHPEYALIDPDDTSDPAYPEGFHLAHLCAEHQEPALRLEQAASA